MGKAWYKQNSDDANPYSNLEHPIALGTRNQHETILRVSRTCLFGVGVAGLLTELLVVNGLLTIWLGH